MLCWIFVLAEKRWCLDQPNDDAKNMAIDICNVRLCIDPVASKAHFVQHFFHAAQEIQVVTLSSSPPVAQPAWNGQSAGQQEASE